MTGRLPPPADDLDRLMAVMACAFDPAFGEAWSRRQVEDALLMGHCHYALLSEQGTPPGDGADAAGFTLSRHIAGEEELLLIAVRPDARGHGLGRRLLADLAAAARARGATRLLLEMRDGNPAEHLYRATGFVPIGRRPNYYRNGDQGRLDAITLALML